MSTAIPPVPPRPTRAQEQTTVGNETLGSDLPQIPPRPTRRIERSVSPQRESFAQSPLNEPTHSSNNGKSPLYSSEIANNPHSNLSPLSSSVILPSIGQEGNEYAEIFGGASEDQVTSSTQTRNVANDLKLHAPKPSLPISSAKQRLSTVTRTDSGQAAAFGIGRPRSISDDKDPASRKLKEKASFASQASTGTERPPSSLESEHGIPEIGQRVPMYPNAGDVQAPPPSPFATPYAPGIGFHNDGSKPRHHGRRTSARGEIPPDAYGRYGHGVPHQSDRFEKAYYEKHPEIFKKELGQYGEGKPEWAMSSDDLNKIVRDTASRSTGTGKSKVLMGTPTEQVGFQASEEYTSRMSSPRPQSGYHVLHSNTSGTHVDSPLRKESFPTEGSGKAEFEGTLSRSLHAPSDLALESEVEDEDIIHVDEPNRRSSKVYGGAGRYESTEDLGHQSGHSGDENENHDEHGYGAPILASDEVAKEPFGWELQPAVSPMTEHRGSYHDESGYQQRHGSDSNVSNSRPSSRPGSIHGLSSGPRLPESTPLEDLEEYEPLFPEDEKIASTKQQKPFTAADRLRPELKNRKFPSQDIWEDTPNSLQYTATVSTPQLPEDIEESTDRLPESDTEEKAFARRQEALAESEFKDTESFLHQEHQKTNAWERNIDLLQETRSGMKQRFPSKDIWEDTPDSLQLQTTVGGPQADENIMSPPDERPTTGAVAYHQEKAAAGLPMGSEEGRATTGIAATLKPQIPARPAIPERPAQRSRQVEGVLGSSPPLPIKTKPPVPGRPSKPITRESSENVPLTTVTSNSSAKSVGSDQSAAAAAKPKPPVPSRPVGSKIAALQGGFLSDLNKRLQLGPQAPKKDETSPVEQAEEKEKAPLTDARKGRARGPARRAPAKSPTPVADSTPTLAFSMPSTLWEIDPEEDELHVTNSKEEALSPVTTNAAQSSTLTTSTNASGMAIQQPSEITPGPGPSESEPLAAEDAHTEQLEEVEDSPVAAGTINSEPTTVTQSSEVVEEDLTVSMGAPKASSDLNVE